MQERLISCAIIRFEIIHSFGCKSHADIRARLHDEDAYRSKRGDTEGFLTDTGRFVNRFEAQKIGMENGQVTMESSRLLSSEVMWDRKKPEATKKFNPTSKPKSGKRWQSRGDSSNV